MRFSCPATGKPVIGHASPCRRRHWLRSACGDAGVRPPESRFRNIASAMRRNRGRPVADRNTSEHVCPWVFLTSRQRKRRLLQQPAFLFNFSFYGSIFALFQLILHPFCPKMNDYCQFLSFYAQKLQNIECNPPFLADFGLFGDNYRWKFPSLIGRKRPC